MATIMRYLLCDSPEDWGDATEEYNDLFTAREVAQREHRCVALVEYQYEDHEIEDYRLREMGEPFTRKDVEGLAPGDEVFYNETLDRIIGIEADGTLLHIELAHYGYISFPIAGNPDEPILDTRDKFEGNEECALCRVEFD